jgi:hypothetical protein
VRAFSPCQETQSSLLRHPPGDQALIKSRPLICKATIE